MDQEAEASEEARAEAALAEDTEAVALAEVITVTTALAPEALALASALDRDPFSVDGITAPIMAAEAVLADFWE